MNRREFLAGAGATALALKGGAATAEGLGTGETAFSVTALNPDCMVGGAGLCVVIRMPSGKTYLFDTGNGDFRGQKAKNNGKDIIAPWLVAHGIREIDGVIISHYHADHFGGFLWLWKNFPIRRVYDNSFVPSDGKPLGFHYARELEVAQKAMADWEKEHPDGLVRNTRVGTELGWDEPGVSCEVVWPPRDFYCEAIEDFKKSSATDFPFHHLLNANSTAIRIKVGERTFYIGGDNAGKQYVQKYIRPYHEQNGTWGADAIVLPGHGDPDIWADIAAMSPKPVVAVGSLGNLPWMMVRGRQVLENHVDRGGIRKTYCTNVHGDVTFSCDGRAIRVSCDPENLYIHDPK